MHAYPHMYVCISLRVACMCMYEGSEMSEVYFTKNTGKIDLSTVDSEWAVVIKGVKVNHMHNTKVSDEDTTRLLTSTLNENGLEAKNILCGWSPFNVHKPTREGNLSLAIRFKKPEDFQRVNQVLEMLELGDITYIVPVMIGIAGRGNVDYIPK